VAALRLLPQLFAEVTTSKLHIKGRGYATNKYNRQEMADAIIQLVDPAKVKSAAEEYAARSSSKGYADAPVLFLGGTSWSEKENYFLYICPEVLYHFHSAKAALSSTFHALWALNAPYPAPASGLWTIIEKVVFGLDPHDHSKLTHQNLQIIDEITSK